MDRIVNAFFNSLAAFKQLGSSEKAFQQELAVLAAAVPIAMFLTDSIWLRAALIGSLVFVLVVEVLNTGIEAACNAVTREFNKDIKIAKDAGSLAVLLSICLAGAIWLMAVWTWYYG